MGLPREQMNDAIKSSAITALGPSLVVLSAMIALLVSLGGPISWTRLSFIGSVMYEMMVSGFGTQAVGDGMAPPIQKAYSSVQQMP